MSAPDPWGEDPWLDVEHRRAMDAGRAEVPWDACTAATLDPTLRARVAALWRARAESERRSVAIFSTWAVDLVGARAEAPFLSLVARAAVDEVRHAELFEALARCYGAAPEPPSDALPALPDDPRVPLRWQASREALELSVIGEGFSFELLQDLRAAARDPAVRGALAVVLGDEALHARVGWRWLAAQRDAPDADALRAWLQEGLVPAFERFVAAVFGDLGAALGEAPDPDAAALRAHGATSLARMGSLFVELVHALWAPGLASLGFDTAPLTRRYPRSP